MCIWLAVQGMCLWLWALLGDRIALSFQCGQCVGLMVLLTSGWDGSEHLMWSLVACGMCPWNGHHNMSLLALGFRLQLGLGSEVSL